MAKERNIMSVVEELGISGRVSLGGCSDKTLKRWTEDINSFLEANNYDWRVVSSKDCVIQVEGKEFDLGDTDSEFIGDDIRDMKACELYTLMTEEQKQYVYSKYKEIKHNKKVKLLSHIFLKRNKR